MKIPYLPYESKGDYFGIGTFVISTHPISLNERRRLRFMKNFLDMLELHL